MRIVHVIDYFQPKLGYQETFLARAQAKLGHDIYVVTSDRYNPQIYSENKKLLGNRIKGAGCFNEEGIIVWRLKTLFELPHIIWVLGLEKKVKELKPDLVIVHGVVNLQAIRIARLKKKLGNFKLVYDDHMTFAASRSPMRVLYLPFRWFFAGLIQESADGLVGVSETSRMFMHKKYGFPLERIAFISLAADSELFRFNPSARKEMRKRLSIDDDDTVFIYAGKTVPVKGPHLLVKAALELMERHNNLKVILVGNGPPEYIQEMKQSVEAAGRQDRFIWLAAVPNRELPGLYSAVDVAVWPREASLSMLEAMACNLPVIISDTSEVTERISNNNGLVYRGDDASDLARQMERLTNPELRKEMGANGRRLVEEKLSWEVIARQFLELVTK